jgi:hypothetical protein
MSSGTILHYTTEVTDTTTTTTATDSGTYTVSGTITGVISANLPVVMTGAASHTINTDAAGYYEFSALASGYYIIAPTLEGYVFDPEKREITYLTNNLTDIDFVSNFAPLCAAEVLYGENSEQVEHLRVFRDGFLSKTPAGRELIRLYYEWSPVIVKVIRQDTVFKEEIIEVIDEALELIAEEKE